MNVLLFYLMMNNFLMFFWIDLHIYKQLFPYIYYLFYLSSIV